MLLYHGSKTIVEFPEIRTGRYNKDFYFGFYCTSFKNQAIRWAVRYTGTGVLNEYEYNPNKDFNIRKFDTMTDEWLDFIVECRSGVSHNYDIVEGPMADDTIFNYIQSFKDGEITRAAFWELAKFKKPTHQISFHTARALTAIKFLKGYTVTDEGL